MMKKKILISGTGIAGILCAALLDKEKFDIEIIEKGDSFRNVGFSLVLWKSGFNNLISALGKSGENLSEGKDYFKIKDFILFSGLHLENTKKLDSDNFAWVFERAHLMEALERMLFKHVPKESIQFSKTITNIAHLKNGTNVEFNTGEKKEYDLVIISEGINSTSRAILFPNELVKPCSYNLKYAWFKKETALGQSGALFATQGHIGVIHPPCSKNLIGFYSKNNTKDVFEARMLEAIGQKTELHETIDFDTARIFTLQEVFLKCYFKNNVVLLGDAAHGRPPTLGFGASLATEDAVQLCTGLNALSLEDFNTLLKNTLSSFSKVRSERVEKVYSFQKLLQGFITDNKYKAFMLSIFLKLFFAKYMEYKVKKLALYVIDTNRQK